MTLLKDNNYKDINIALLSLEADIKKLGNNSSIASQLADINRRIDEINKDSGGSTDIDEIKADVKNLKNDVIAINSDIYNIENDITNINTNIDNIEQQLSNIFTAENKVTDFNATTNSGIYYWIDDAANKPGTNYGVLLVNKYDGGSGSIWVNQVAYGTNGRIYFRQKINDTNWIAWKAVAFDGEITAKKVSNALTVNGKTYDGSSAVNAGVQTVANGGTGVTTQADINKAFIGNLEVGISDVTDGTEFVSSYASDNGFADTNAVNVPYKRKFLTVWNYIKGKISSVLGLTKDNYGGKASTAGTADRAKNMYQQNFDLSSLDKTKFYPLVCLPSNNFSEVAIYSGGGVATAEYNQNRIHFDISTTGWSDIPPTLNIREYACYDNSEITIGCIGRGIHTGAWAIWLRGGIRYYCFSRDNTLSLKTSNYTFGDETYTVGTNYYGGSNTNVSIWFTPQSTITEGAYSSRPITAPNIKAKGNITLDGDGGASLSTYGSEPLSIGYPSGTNDGKSLSLDRNSIQARKNGAASYMYLNYYGGMVSVNDQNKSDSGLKVKQKMVIPIGAPSTKENGCIWIG